MTNATGKTKAWYRDGLRFECTRCGHCCGGEPGSVRLNAQEVEGLARGLDLEVPAFLRIYTRRLQDGELSLRERSNGDCVFFASEVGCRVYALRPRQCRTWPFWAAVVQSPVRWAQEAQHCPGMNRGMLHEAAEIGALAADDGTSDGILSIDRSIADAAAEEP